MSLYSVALYNFFTGSGTTVSELHNSMVCQGCHERTWVSPVNTRFTPDLLQTFSVFDLTELTEGTQITYTVDFSSREVILECDAQASNMSLTIGCPQTIYYKTNLVEFHFYEHCVYIISLFLSHLNLICCWFAYEWLHPALAPHSFAE